MENLVELVLDHMSDTEMRKAFVLLAQNGHSVAIVNVLDDVLTDRVDAWEIEARRCYAEGRRVQGIKLCRQATGKGLKEALDYCDERFPRGDIIR